MKQNKKTISILTAIICLLLGGFLWQGIYLPKSSNGAPPLAGRVVGGLESKAENLFLIEKGQGLQEISENLEKENLIKSKIFFELYVFFNKKQNQLQAGGYFLSLSMNVPEIVEKFVSGKIAKVKITVPEGFTIKQIEEKINELFNTTRTVLVVLRVGDFKNEFGFLTGTPDDLTLEGFLFPDTYQFFYNESSDEIARKMLKNFEKKLDLNLKEEIEKQGKSIFETVIMASLLEKEIKTLGDKKLVSGILWKRLENGIPLQVDATITYITEKKTTKVLKEDLQIDSPYNTYKYSGLPIGPICNPGLESIKAAIYPEDSNFWYYLSKPDGDTIFSKTLEEHNIAKAKYLR